MFVRKTLLSESSYPLPDSVPQNRFALSGIWNLAGDRATSSADGDEILLRFDAPKVNLVAGSSSPQALSIIVDGTPQPPVTVDGSRLYSLYSGTSGEHVLRPRSEDRNPSPVAVSPKTGIFRHAAGDFRRFRRERGQIRSLETDSQFRESPLLAGISPTIRGNFSERRTGWLVGWRRSADRTSLQANSLVSGNFTGNFAILGLGDTIYY
jgi:hypothetical protein